MAEDGKAQGSRQEEMMYGGQAVMEGVMMRGRYIAAIAVRNPDGVIVVREEPVSGMLYRGRIAKLPFVRGVTGLWDALVLGMRSLLWSADVAMEEEEDIDVSFSGAFGVGTVIVSLAIMIGFFFMLPAAISDVLETWLNVESGVLTNFIEAVIRLALLIGYIAVVGQMEDIKRVFAYHGAEHKTINAYEAGAALSPDGIAPFSTRHPRCGTGFLLIVAFISFLVFVVLGRPENIFLLMLSRVLLVPVIAGIAYEVIRFTARNLDNPVIATVAAPGLALQRLTTREPSPEMLEVASVALKRVIAAEEAQESIPERREERIERPEQPEPAEAA
jgi:uncharacterized protein YqhQ